MKIKYITSLIDNLNDFINIRSEWDVLLEYSEESNPFLSHQWLLTWWEVYGHGTLHIVTCRDTGSGQLVGLLPLFRFQTGMFPPVNTLRFLGSEQVSSDFLCCIARKGLERDVYKACLESLRQDVDLWEILELNDMDEASSFYRYLSNGAIAGFKVVQVLGQSCPFLSNPDSWEALLHNLSSKMRRNVRYYRRLLDRKGVVLEQVTDSEDLSGALADMERLRIDRMDQRGITTAKITETYHRFHLKLMHRFLDCHRLRLYFLRLDNQRVAYLYLFAGSGNLYAYQTGFDRAMRDQSVGFVLFAMVIEQGINEGLTTFEFLRGQEPYKYNWTSTERRLAKITIYRKSFIGLLYFFKTTVFLKMKFFIKKIIAFFDIKQCINR